MASYGCANKRMVSVLAIAALGGLLAFAGCSGGPKYPDSEAAVNNALAQDNLSAVHVSQNRNTGVITLTGTLSSQQQKLRAEDDARSSAPKYTVADETAVVAPPTAVVAAQSDTDIAIQDRFNRELKEHRYFAHDTIAAKSTNGKVVLTGTVRTEFDKREAEKLAKAIPNVHQVENDLTIAPRGK
ncbi:MAG: BON domain-containing protein [Acidobacteriaceae bacterium]